MRPDVLVATGLLGITGMPMVGRLARVLWGLAVTVFVLLFAYERREELLKGIEAIDLGVLGGAVLLVCLAKLGFVWNVQFAARQFEICLGWKDSFRIYNLTQLAKYIPGSIWQFVGRFAVLRARGVEASRIRDSLLAEHLWVIGIASLLGILLLAWSDATLLVQSAKWVDDDGASSIIWVLVVAGASVGGGIVVWRFRMLRRWAVSLLPPWYVIPLLIVTWLLFGAALWVTLVPFAPEVALTYIVGLYCIAYVVGFVVPFAPAGLGVREALLVLGLVPIVATETAVLLAVANRLVYLSAEMVLAMFCIGKPGGSRPEGEIQ